MGTSSSGFDLRDALEDVRDLLAPHVERAAGYAKHGFRDLHRAAVTRDIRDEILLSLATQPMHGYEVIQSIEARTGTAPTAGAVYPVLQQLVDEGLASSALGDERTVYTLTETGADAASALSADADDAAGPASGRRPFADWDERSALPKAGAKLAGAARQVAFAGTVEQQDRAAAVLDSARRELYAILAEE